MNTVAQESERATAVRGTSSSLVTLVRIFKGRGNQSYNSRQERSYNTDFSSRTPRNEASLIMERFFYHKVVNGETLETIAKQHGISIDQLCRQNRIGKLTRVSEGQLLSITK